MFVCSGAAIHFHYDASQRLVSITGAHGTTTLSSFTYAYASGANDTALRQSVVDGVANTTTSYAYDGLNRLTGATTVLSGAANPNDPQNPSSYQYGYDATGNRTSTTVGGAGTSASFNEADEETSWNLGQPQPRTYTYDANGNETGSSAGESRTYNSRNQTISIAGLNGTLTPIGYLDSGQSERTSAGGSTYANSSLGIQSEKKVGADDVLHADTGRAPGQPADSEWDVLLSATWEIVAKCRDTLCGWRHSRGGRRTGRIVGRRPSCCPQR